MEVIGDFNERGNVKTVIKVTSDGSRQSKRIKK